MPCLCCYLSSDVLVVLEATSGRDLSAWSKAWLETSGVNTLTCEPDGTLRQQGRLRPHRIAVGGYGFDATGAVVRTRRAELDVTGESTPLPETVREAAFVLVNDDDLSYCKVVLNEAQFAFAFEYLSEFRDPMPRSLMWSALWNMTRDGALPGRRFLELVDRHAASESHMGVLSNLLDQSSVVLDRYLDA